MKGKKGVYYISYTDIGSPQEPTNEIPAEQVLPGKEMTHRANEQLNITYDGPLKSMWNLVLVQYSINAYMWLRRINSFLTGITVSHTTIGLMFFWKCLQLSIKIFSNVKFFFSYSLLATINERWIFSVKKWIETISFQGSVFSDDNHYISTLQSTDAGI